MLLTEIIECVNKLDLPFRFAWGARYQVTNSSEIQLAALSHVTAFGTTELRARPCFLPENSGARSLAAACHNLALSRGGICFDTGATAAHGRERECPLPDGEATAADQRPAEGHRLAGNSRALQTAHAAAEPGDQPQNNLGVGGIVAGYLLGEN